MHQIFFFRGALNRTIYQIIQKISVFRVFNKNINFSTEFQYRVSLKKQQFITWYSSLHSILLKMTALWKKKLAPQKLLYCNEYFSRFGNHFDDRPKILTYRQIPSNVFYLKLSYENNSKSSTEKLGFFLRKHRFTKEGCADLHTSDMNKIEWVRTVMLWEFFLLCLSLVKVIQETESI